MGQDVVNYKCPNCAAPMEFGISSQKWECHFCFSSFTAEDLEKIEVHTGSKTEASSWEVASFSGEEAVAYSCPDCGGRVLTDPHTVATFCVYCHSPTIIADRLTGEQHPAFLLPFQLEKEKAVQAVQALCKMKPFLPRDFKEAVDKGEIEGLYVPYWLFDADILSELTAVGSRYTIWRDTQYEYTKTDLYDVSRRAIFPLRRVPADASSRMNDQLMEAIEPFRYADLIPFAMQYLSGHFAESFDVDAATSYKQFEQRAEQSVSQKMRALASEYDSLRIASLTNTPKAQETFYVMLPVWTVSVRYKEKYYTFAMNGQTGKSAGNLPVSYGRLFAFLLGLFGILSVVFTLFGGFFL